MSFAPHSVPSTTYCMHVGRCVQCSYKCKTMFLNISGHSQMENEKKIGGTKYPLEPIEINQIDYVISGIYNFPQGKISAMNIYGTVNIIISIGPYSVTVCRH